MLESPLAPFAFLALAGACVACGGDAPKMRLGATHVQAGDSVVVRVSTSRPSRRAGPR